MTNNLLLPLYTAFAPFVAWMIEQVIPLPFVVEEVIKMFLVLLYRGNDEGWRYRMRLGMMIGIIFALSESIFYLSMILSSGSFWVYLTRLAYTIPMHVVTSLFIVFSFRNKRKWSILIGLFAACVLHWLYNKFLGHPPFGAMVI